jgi:hypothetical protein
MEQELVKKLTNVESEIRGTSLVTLYLPAGGNL